RRLLVRLAIAPEAIGAKGKGKRRQPRMRGRRGETISARREQRRQGAGPKRVCIGLAGALDRKQHACERAVGPRQKPVTTGLWLEPGGCGDPRGGGVEPPSPLRPTGGGHEGDRYASAVGWGKYRVEGHDSCTKCHAGGTRSSPVNLPLGLTFYCWWYRVGSPG